jgi:hypothetical protein
MCQEPTSGPSHGRPNNPALLPTRSSDRDTSLSGITTLDAGCAHCVDTDKRGDPTQPNADVALSNPAPSTTHIAICGGLGSCRDPTRVSPSPFVPYVAVMPRPTLWVFIDCARAEAPDTLGKPCSSWSLGSGTRQPGPESPRASPSPGPLLLTAILLIRPHLAAAFVASVIQVSVFLYRTLALHSRPHLYSMHVYRHMYRLLPRLHVQLNRLCCSIHHMCHLPL